MNKFIYIRSDGMLCVVTPMKKTKIEDVKGPMTEQEYVDFVWNKSIPDDATGARYIDDSDLPDSREFRNAWVDTESGTQIDIDVDKARELVLIEMNLKKNTQIKALTGELAYYKEIGDQAEVDSRVRQITSLMASTSGLEAINTKGKVNDQATLAKIRVERKNLD